MQQVSHQTVKLGRGRHTSPEYGACVMELASMLAGEPFNDHPRCVSPAIASFLRAYNDMLDDERRQDLYAYAAKTVGTVALPSVERARAARLMSWGDEIWERYRRSAILGRFRLRRVRRDGRCADPQTSARYAIQSIRRLSSDTHAAALSLVDELIAMSSAADQAGAAVSRAGVTPSESPMISATSS